MVIEDIKEAFQLKSRVRKSDERGSYDYAREGRPGNPYKESVHPTAYPITKALHFPIGFTIRLERRESSALKELRKEAQRAGYHGVFDVCRNYGGFNCRGPERKAKLKLGQIDTTNRGLRIIIENFEV